MFYVVIFVAIFAAPMVAQAGQMPAWQPTLSPYLQQLPQTNPGLAAITTRAEATGSFATASRALPDPVIGIGIQALPTDGSLTREPMTQAPVVTLKQVIPSPAARRSNAAVLRASQQMQLAQSTMASEEAALRLTRAAFNYVRLQAEQAAVLKTIDSYDLLLSSSDARYRAGKGLRQDVDQLKVTIARLQAELLRLRAGIAQARSDWAALLESDLPATLNLAPEVAWRPDAAVTAAVLNGNPWLQSETRQVETTRLRHTAERSAFRPNLAVELGYGIRQRNRRDFMSAKVGVSVPLWARWSQGERLTGAALNLAAAKLQRDDARANVLGRLTTLLSAHADAAGRQALYDNTVLPAAQAARASARSAYEAGGVDIFVPIAATQRELDSQRDYARIVAERQQIEASLLALQGRLVQGDTFFTTSNGPTP